MKHKADIFISIFMDEDKNEMIHDIKAVVLKDAENKISDEQSNKIVEAVHAKSVGECLANEIYAKYKEDGMYKVTLIFSPNEGKIKDFTWTDYHATFTDSDMSISELNSDEYYKFVIEETEDESDCKRENGMMTLMIKKEDDKFDTEELYSQMLYAATITSNETENKKIAIQKVDCDGGWDAFEKELRIMFRNSGTEVVFCEG